MWVSYQEFFLQKKKKHSVKQGIELIKRIVFIKKQKHRQFFKCDFKILSYFCRENESETLHKGTK